MDTLIWLNGISVLLLTLFFGKLGLPYIVRLQLGQIVRDDGPKTHFKKSGTPTFGGLFFLSSLAISAVVLPLLNPNWLKYSIIIILMLCFGIVGFIDDYIKVRIDKDGLSVIQKTIALTIVCILFAIWFLWFSDFEPFIYLPFIKKEILVIGNWKFLYLIFIVLYLFFMANAVNITDGIDGLASSLMTVTSLFLALCIYLIFDSSIAMKPLIGACVALAAGCLGFFAYNKYPAKIFMGDTGSQALGAAFAAVALLAGIPWIMIILGLIYILEALSTLIQVLYFKLTKGKRIFKMAPLHHHFELSGWSELKVVINFIVFTLVCGLLSVAIVVL